jgi:hypothetical protein
LPKTADCATVPGLMSNPATPPLPHYCELPLDRLRYGTDPVFATLAENASLQDSIRDFGILTPLVVTPNADGWHTVIDGQRRLACAKKLHLTMVPCVITEILTEGEYHQRRFLLNTMTKPWTQAETIAFLKRLGLPPSKAKTIAKLSGPQASAELRTWLHNREPK